MQRRNNMAKRFFSILIAVTMLFSLAIVVSMTGCSYIFEPIYVRYGDIVYEAVDKYYENYDILWLYQLTKDREPTLYDFCIIDDLQGGIDVMLLTTAYTLDENNQKRYYYDVTDIIDNIEFGNTYSTDDNIDSMIVEFVVCEEDKIPDTTIQKAKFEYNKQTLFFCVTSITDS